MQSFCDTLKQQNKKALDEDGLPIILDEQLIQSIEEKIDLILLPACYTSRILYGDITNPSLYRHLWEYFQSIFLQRDCSIDERIDIW